jgi:hypothetical protein
VAVDLSPHLTTPVKLATAKKSLLWDERRTIMRDMVAHSMALLINTHRSESVLKRLSLLCWAISAIRRA